MTVSIGTAALLCCALAIGGLAAAQDSPAKDVLPQVNGCVGHLVSVISAGGCASSQPACFMAAALGQPTPIGIASGDGCVLYAGFMPPYTIDYLCRVPDPIPVDRMTINAYPNPFTSSTLIEYSLARPTQVSITVYDVAGRKVNDLVTATKSPGIHRNRWDGRDWRGTAVSSGVYWCVLKAGGSTMVRKILVIR